MTKGTSLSATGLSQVEPVPVSPVPASIPSANVDLVGRLKAVMAKLELDSEDWLAVGEASDTLALRAEPDETTLIVAPKDRPLAWLEMGDVALGRVARNFIVISNRQNIEASRAQDVPMVALMSMHGAIALCRMAHEANAGTFTTKLDGVSSASGEIGDWTVTVKRRRDRDGSGEAGQTAEQAGPKATARKGIAP